jgi:isopenicillin-N N-acyltransferase-like protein
MWPFEARRKDREWMASSLVRYNRARRLLKNNLGKITAQTMMEALADHAGYPRSICYHGALDNTVFSVVIDLSSLTMYLAWGNPCEAEFRKYDLLTRE